MVRRSVLVVAVVAAGCHAIIDADRHTSTDGGSPDAGVDDGGPPDLGADAFAADLGPVDLGAPDLGRDAGPVDGGDPCLSTSCDDADPCTADSCVDGVCEHVEEGDPDGDGVRACEGDCAPDEPSVHPGNAELCDGADQDCDERVDEGAAASCSLPGATATCTGGTCAIESCESGRLDCGSAPGCEVVAATDPLHCGGCGVACTDGACLAGGCAFAADGFATTAVIACVLRPGGGLSCWERASQPDPTPLLSLVGDASQVDAGTRDLCATRAGGGVSCFGRTQSGTAATWPDAPVIIGSMTDAEEVGVGLRHACARRTGGQVACWGHGEGRALGPSVESFESSVNDAVAIPGITGALELDAAWRHTVVRTASGLFWWGSVDGPGGSRPAMTSATPTAITLPPGVSPAQVDVTRSHGCFVSTAGEVWCWGRNADGELGDGTTTATEAPVRAHSFTDAAQVAVAEGISCVRRTGGAMSCWGRNGSRFGTGSFSPSSSATPVAPMGAPAARWIAVTDFSGHLIDTSGRLWGWAGNVSGVFAFETRRRMGNALAPRSAVGPIE